MSEPNALPRHTPGAPAPDAWQPVARRDRVMARLLRALYEHRQEILQIYPRVPLSTRPGASPQPVAALLLLWERCPYFRGPCPQCGAVALGQGFGGLLSIGSVEGCCLGCARVVTRRVSGIGRILSCLHASLDDSPYRLWPLACPTPPGADYGGWGWRLEPRPKAIIAVLQELGADVPA